jgi:hypothetical protein
LGGGFLGFGFGVLAHWFWDFIILFFSDDGKFDKKWREDSEQTI